MYSRISELREDLAYYETIPEEELSGLERAIIAHLNKEIEEELKTYNDHMT